MITVITICFNEAEHIDNTVRSVYDQSYMDMEYIIKDGGSRDVTPEHLKKWESSFRKKGVPFIVSTCQDKGIYDAMNQAVGMAKGEFVNFMNAGDRFVSYDVIENIFKNDELSRADLIYGDTVEEEYGELHYFRKCPELITERMPFSHQSVFVRRDLLLKYPFSMKYSIASDYDFLLTLYEKGYSFMDSGIAVAKVSKDGTSSVRLKDTYIETMNLRKEHSLPVPEGIALKVKLLWLGLKQFGMDHFPDSLKFIIRKVQRKLRGQKRYGA